MDTRNPACRSRPGSGYVAVWFGFGLLDAIDRLCSSCTPKACIMPGASSSSRHRLSLVPWALATAPIMRLNQRFPITQWRSSKTWLVHLSACVATRLRLRRLVSPPSSSSSIPTQARPTTSPFTLVWLSAAADGIIFLPSSSTAPSLPSTPCSTHALASPANRPRPRASTSNSPKRSSMHVRRQIEPHFLFNTLNSVSALIREHRNDAAVMMIAGLSDFLRRLLADPSRQQVPLAEEMEFAQKYLDIQKVRFVDRLQLAVDVPSDLLVAQVPTLILQLMVENAIKHGIAKRAHGGLVRISASRYKRYTHTLGLQRRPEPSRRQSQPLRHRSHQHAHTPARALRRRLRTRHAQPAARRRRGLRLGSVHRALGALLSADAQKIRTVIVDDEPLARSNLRLLLEPNPAIDIVAECGSGPDAPAVIRRARPDLLFLDVQMPECDGFDVIELLGADLPPAIVFVTAYDHYALRAFEAGALDYLLKPFDNARFDLALSRAKQKIELGKDHPRKFDRLTIKSAGQIAFIALSEIDWIEAADYYAASAHRRTHAPASSQPV